MPKKKGLFGCSFPLLIAIVVIFLAIFAVGFASGPLGKSVLGNIGLPDWLSVAQPHPELPAEVVFHIFGFPITNSVVGGWVTVVFLVGFSYLISRRAKLIPCRLQGLMEFVLGSLLSFCQSVAGEKNGRRFFPVVATIFLFVIFNAWLSLLPGYGSILITNAEGETTHLLRGANTDVNMPLALAISSFIAVAYFGFKSLGIHYLANFINVKQFLAGVRQLARGKIGSGLGGMLTGIVNIFIGLIEMLSQFIRIVSFTFRLFGVSTAGEILLLVGMFLGIRILIEFFYGIELLFGFVQALIFGGLTLIFLTIAVSSHEHNEEANHSK